MKTIFYIFLFSDDKNFNCFIAAACQSICISFLDSLETLKNVDSLQLLEEDCPGRMMLQKTQTQRFMKRGTPSVKKVNKINTTK